MEGSLPHGRARLSGKLEPSTARGFILANTAEIAPPHVPEIRLRLADEAHALWLKTEEELEAIGLPPPFWAFAWAGGQGLARYVLDHPELVRGKKVLDFATGSGLVAIAAARAGASHVAAADIDPFSAAAVALNAKLNEVAVDFVSADLIGQRGDWQVVLAGDVFYERALAETLAHWFGRLSEAGIEVVLGDPGRAYLPRDRLERLAVYDVAVTRVLEDAEVKRTTVWRFT